MNLKWNVTRRLQVVAPITRTSRAISLPRWMNFIKKLTAKRDSLKRSMDWMKSYLNTSLKGEKFKDVYHSIYYSKSTSLEVDENKLIDMDEAYKTVTVKANTTAIKEALNGGAVIDGCALVTKSNIVIR